jgi:hypothetical protein
MTDQPKADSVIVHKHTDIQQPDNASKPTEVPQVTREEIRKDAFASAKRMPEGGLVGDDGKAPPQIFKQDDTYAGLLLRMDVPGYEALARQLHAAYLQSASGKGRERHANDLPFHEQPIMQIARMSGIGGHVYQVGKKAQEAGSMVSRGEFDRAIEEFKGVIVYAAAAMLLASELRSKAQR